MLTDTLRFKKVKKFFALFLILQMLLKSRGQVVRRDSLNREIFEKDPADGGRAMDVHVRHIRKKLEEAAVTGCVIETIRGTGYRI